MACQNTCFSCVYWTFCDSGVRSPPYSIGCCIVDVVWSIYFQDKMRKPKRHNPFMPRVADQVHYTPCVRTSCDRCLIYYSLQTCRGDSTCTEHMNTSAPSQFLVQCGSLWSLLIGAGWCHSTVSADCRWLTFTKKTAPKKHLKTAPKKTTLASTPCWC